MAAKQIQNLMTMLIRGGNSLALSNHSLNFGKITRIIGRSQPHICPSSNTATYFQNDLLGVMLTGIHRDALNIAESQS